MKKLRGHDPNHDIAGTIILAVMFLACAAYATGVAFDLYAWIY